MATENGGERSETGVRVQPLPVEVPEYEPFKNDLLGRKAFGEALSASLGAVEGPGVFALDGQWGTGKTTFLRMFTQLLRNQKYRVIKINAWETDFAQDSLAALSSSLVTVGEDKGHKKNLRAAAARLLRVAGPAAIRLFTAGAVSLDQAAQQEVGNALAKWAESGLDRFEEHEKSLRAFKDALEGLAAERDDRPIVLIVDELDRCRPTYAVAMLETIKHVFDVNGLIFVLAVNRSQLDRSAKTLYGEFDDPESYFKRFFDVELRLPDSDRKSVVSELLRQVGLRQDDVPGLMLEDFLAAGPQGIRVMTRTIQQYAIVHASLQRFQNESWWWMLPTFVLLRLIDESAYRGLLGGSRSDAEVVESVFDLQWARGLRGKASGNAFEAAVIVVSTRRHGTSPLSEHYESEEEAGVEKSPLGSGQPDSSVLWWVAKMRERVFNLEHMIGVVADSVNMLELRSDGGD